MGKRTRGAHYGVGGPLERKTDVDEGRNGLDASFVLGVVEKVALATLICRMPLEDVELSGALALALAVVCGP